MTDAAAVPVVSIIYVSWNTADELRRSLGAWIGHSDVEAIVVDNASSDGTPEVVQREFPQVRLIANPDNRGFAAAVNQGWHEARGRFLLVLNPDTLVTPDTLQSMVTCMEERPDVAACAPELVDEEGNPTENARPFPPLTLRLNKRTRQVASPQDGASSVHWLMGACILIRREAMEATGGFDEGYFLYAEDIDWCYRARMAGWEIVLLKGLQGVHLGDRSARQVPSRLSEWRRFDGYFRFLVKAHGCRWARANYLWWLVRAGVGGLRRGTEAGDFDRSRFLFCLRHLRDAFWTCRFGRNHVA